MLAHSLLNIVIFTFEAAVVKQLADYFLPIAIEAVFIGCIAALILPKAQEKEQSVAEKDSDGGVIIDTALRCLIYAHWFGRAQPFRSTWTAP